MSNMNRQKRIEWLTQQINEQCDWIRSCEDNGISYADGSRGRHIRRADMDALTKLVMERDHLSGGRRYI